MSTKLLAVLMIFAINVLVSADENYGYTIELLDPTGFRVLHPENTHNGHPTSFYGRINRVSGADGVQLRGHFEQRSDGWWVYQNTAATLYPGDSLFYDVTEDSGWCGVVYALHFHVPLDAPRVAV